MTSFGGGSGGHNDHVVRLALKRGSCSPKTWNQSARATYGYIPSKGEYGQSPECHECPRQLVCMSGDEPREGQYACSSLVGLEATYFRTCILEVDLKNKRITDHGQRNYSSSTTRNHGYYVHAVRHHLGDQVPLDALQHFDDWMSPDYGRVWARNSTVRAFSALLLEGCPWLTKTGRRGAYWFEWEKFDKERADALIDSVRLLNYDQNWRYFRYSWQEEEGKKLWVRDFINGATEKRYHRRQDKRSRTLSYIASGKEPLNGQLPRAVF